MKAKSIIYGSDKKKSKEEIYKMYLDERQRVHHFIKDVIFLRQQNHDLFRKDELIKKVACEFALKLHNMYVREGEYGSRMFRMNTHMAPGMLVESVEQIYERGLYVNSLLPELHDAVLEEEVKKNQSEKK